MGVDYNLQLTLDQIASALNEQAAAMDRQADAMEVIAAALAKQADLKFSDE